MQRLLKFWVLACTTPSEAFHCRAQLSALLPVLTETAHPRQRPTPCRRGMRSQLKRFLPPAIRKATPCPDGYPQRAQYPLIKEYSLNHNMKPYII